MFSLDFVAKKWTSCFSVYNYVFIPKEASYCTQPACINSYLPSGRWGRLWLHIPGCHWSASVAHLSRCLQSLSPKTNAPTPITAHVCCASLLLACVWVDVWACVCGAKQKCCDAGWVMCACSGVVEMTAAEVSRQSGGNVKSMLLLSP